MLHLSKDAGGSKNVSRIRFIFNLPMCIIHDLQSICNQQQIIKCAVLIILYVIDMRKYSRFSIKCDPLK